MLKEKNSTYYQSDRKELIPFIPEQYSTVLEIGCGSGVFHDNLKKSKEYWGIEPVESAAQEANGKLSKVIVGLYNDVKDKIPDNYFDLIVCNDVIEHMPDHEEFLCSIKTKMKDKGYLIGSVPNVRCLDNLYKLLLKKDWNYTDAGILDYTHCRFFTIKSLKNSLSKCGYDLEDIRGINPLTEKLCSRIICFGVGIVLGRDVSFCQIGLKVKKRERKESTK